MLPVWPAVEPPATRRRLAGARYPAGMELSPEEVRVLGCLVEKQLTVPEYYPLTMNALLTACNQTSNRNPVVAYTAPQVSAAIDGLRGEHKLARVVFAGSGSRVDRYKHVLDERLGLSPPEIAVMGVLALRGPQTVGEIKGRTERMHDFGSLDDVERVLDRLADPSQPPDLDEFPARADNGMLVTARRSDAPEVGANGLARPWDGPLVERLARLPGQKEGRVMHLLAGPVDIEALTAGPIGVTASTSPARNERMQVLEQQVSDLAEQLRALRVDFDRFREQFS